MTPARATFDLADNRLPDSKFAGQVGRSFARSRSGPNALHLVLGQLRMTVALSALTQTSSRLVTAVFREADVLKVGRQVVQLIPVNVVYRNSGGLGTKEGRGNEVVDVASPSHISVPKAHNPIARRVRRGSLNRPFRRVPHSAEIADFIPRDRGCRHPSFVDIHRLQPLSDEQRQVEKLADALARAR